MSLTHEVGLLLGVIPALLDAAIKLAHHVERLTLLDGQVVVTVAGRPQAFRSPTDALAVTSDAQTTCIASSASRPATARPAVSRWITSPRSARSPSRESCGAIKAELAQVRALAMQARAWAGSEEAAAWGA